MIKKSKHSMIKICTHSGSFHCDEALAISMLLNIPRFKDSKIIRTRELSIIKDCDVVLDVGKIYDPIKNRFDHHQKEFNETFSSSHTIRLSSAGLVYKHFGKEVLGHLLSSSSDKEIETIYNKLYESFIMPVDAIDNGINAYNTKEPPLYKDSTGLGDRVSALNPLWNETNVDYDKQFLKAVELVGNEFSQKVNYYSKAWLPARKIVEDAIKKVSDIHTSNQIIKLEKYCPWKDHLSELEKEHNLDILYVIFPEDGNSSYRIAAVPVNPASFQSKKALPKTWCGLDNEKLEKISNINGTVFVHATGFIGGNKTYEGALQMAISALSHSQ